MKSASPGPCCESLGTERKNDGYVPAVRLVRVADGLTTAMSFAPKRPPVARTSWLPAGPIIPIVVLSATMFGACVLACAASS